MAAVQCKRVQLAPTQTIPNGFNQSTQQQQQLTAASRLVHRQQEAPAAQSETTTSSDLCFKLQQQQQQQQTRRSSIDQQQQQTKATKFALPTLARGANLGSNRKYRTNCVTPTAGASSGELQQTTPTNRLTRLPSTPNKSPVASIINSTTTQSTPIPVSHQHYELAATVVDKSDRDGGPSSQVSLAQHQADLNNLRHWKSATSSLNSAQLAAVRRRRRLVASSTKSLLQLHTATTATTTTTSRASTAASHSIRECHHYHNHQSHQSSQLQRQLTAHQRAGSSLAISEVDASRATKLLTNHNLHRQQIGRLRQGISSPAANATTVVTSKHSTTPLVRLIQPTRRPTPTSLKTTTVVTPSATRVALLAPKRALSCNQLAQKLEQAPKIAKTAPSSAVTNSRLRQGALFARRQCQLAAPFSVAPHLSQTAAVDTNTITTTTTTKTRPPHLTRRDAINQQQQKTNKLARLTQAISTIKTTTSTTKTSINSKPTTRTTITATTTTTAKISSSKTSLPLFSSPKKRDLVNRSAILRRRWSSLESSNNDDSSPSSSSSTLSTNSSSCLHQSALNHLPISGVTIDGRSSLIGRDEQDEQGQADSGFRWSSRRSSSSSFENQQLQSPPSQQQHHHHQHRQKPVLNERCTRQTKPAGAKQTTGSSDETVDNCWKQKQQQNPINPDCSNPPLLESHCLSQGNKDKPINSNSFEREQDLAISRNDLVDCHFGDIVVGQPDCCNFVTLSNGKAIHNLSLECHSEQDNPSNLLTLDNKQHLDNCHGKQDDNSMVLVELEVPFVGLELKSGNHKNNLDGSHQQSSINEMNTKSFDKSNSYSPILDAPPPITSVGFTGNIMISTGHSDNNTTSHHDQSRDDRVETGDNPDEEAHLDKNHQQPLKQLQTINIDKRQVSQQQSKENPVCKPNELSKVLVTKQQQQPPILQKTDDLIPVRQEPICDYYDLEPRPFARGKFAQVKRCVKKDTKECFAAKCIKKRRRLVDIRHEILLEIEALKLSYHTKYIVKLYEVYETPNEMILILEMANGGELQRVLDDEESIDELLVRKMVKQILEGLVHLHDDQIVHLDIKPQNLLLTQPFPDGDIKLCDFGISRRITECEIREICGTPDYTAPEVLQYDPITLNTDMWSLGVVTYVLLSGYSPFGSENKQQTFCNITTCSLDFPPELFDGISEEAIDFVRKLIVLEPSQRLTSRQALTHPWFK